jgi:SPP1 gp7 family putative phage head morphogenesis protein
VAAKWQTTADPKAPAEAVRFFKQKVPLLSAEFLKLRYEARQRAFTVASATRLDQVNDVMQGIARAIEKGESFEKFKRELVDKLGQSWGTKGYALESIFRTNVQSAYSAARWRGANRPENKDARPIGKFNALADGRLCPICADCDGVTLPLDDDWWQSHNPLLHNSCRCEIDTLRPDEADKMTDFEDLPGDVAAEGFGTPASLDDWEPSLDNKNADAVEIFRTKLEEVDFSGVALPNWEE